MGKDHPLESRKHPSSTIQAVVVDQFRVIYQRGRGFEKVKASFSRQGWHIHETKHFLYATHCAADYVHLVHRLGEEDINNNLSMYLALELPEQLSSAQAFDAAFQAVVASVRPQDPLTAWGLFSLNTLSLLRTRREQDGGSSELRDSITSFARLYSRLFSLLVGESLLDVGCACAFWPVLVAEQDQSHQRRIVGLDQRQDAINLSMQLATLAGFPHLEFVLADLLAPTFLHIGCFDTVTALHLLEHLPEDQLPLALNHLLQVTSQRLLIAVPYEDHPAQVYGHEQIFDREKLEQWGNWCLAYLNGRGKVWCEDVEGGLLVVERTGG